MTAYRLKTYFEIILFILTITAFTACKKKDCFNSAGEKTTIQRELAAFNKIEIHNYFNVYLKSDTVNKIEIVAGENQVANIETSVVDSILTINDLNACGFIKGYGEKNLYISVDSLTEVVVHDGINLFSLDTLKFDYLLVRFLSDIGYCNLTVDCEALRMLIWNSSGDYFVSGNAGYLYLNINHLGFVHAENLETEECYVSSATMGDCHVKTSGRLRVFIYDEGNVYYSGEPSEIIVEEKTGTGNLIKED